MIYLDNAATTYPKPEKVYDEMDRVNRNLAVNAGRGSYRLAGEATKIIDEAKRKLLNLVKANEIANVVLTPSATIAMNEIIGGMEWSENDIAYVSPFEHNAVMRTINRVQKQYGFNVEELPLTNDNRIDLDKMEYLFSKNEPTKLFITHISNVTGYVLPIEEITGQAKNYDCEVVVDASQSLGLLNIDMKKTDCDYMVFAGHKNLYGSFGTGGFFMKNGCRLKPYITGGTGSDSLNLEMPENSTAKFEPASPDIIAVAGLNAALDVIDQEDAIQKYIRHEKEMTQKLIEGLSKISGVTVYSSAAPDNIGIVAFNVKGYKASEVGTILDEEFDIAVRTGYHCAPLIHKYLNDSSYYGVVRASVGRFTTEEDIRNIIEAVKDIKRG